MPVISTKVDKNNDLTVETSDLLHDVKIDKKVLEIGKFQVRVEVPLGTGGDAKDAMKGAEKEANKIKDELEKDVENLDKKLKKLLDEDEAGNKKAAAEADKLVKATEKDLKDALPEFGRRVSKAAYGGKKPATTKKSSCSGRFGGIELIAKFTAGEDEYVPYLRELAEGVEKLGKELAKKTADESRVLTTYQDLLKDYFASFDKAARGKPGLTARTFREGDGKKDADKILAAGKDYESHVDELERDLRKASKDLEKLDKCQKTIKDPDRETKAALAESDNFEKTLGELRKTIDDRAKVMNDWRPDDILSDNRKWENVTSKLLKLKPDDTKKLGDELQKAGRKFDDLVDKLGLA